MRRCFNEPCAQTKEEAQTKLHDALSGTGVDDLKGWMEKVNFKFGAPGSSGPQDSPPSLLAAQTG